MLVVGRSLRRLVPKIVPTGAREAVRLSRSIDDIRKAVGVGSGTLAYSPCQ